jgi:hypothetical protein
MKHITIDPSFFVTEGFGTLMSHYASMYCIYRDCGFIPTILTPPKQIQTTLDYFNHSFISSKEFIYNHLSAFPNLNKIFCTIDKDQLSLTRWQKIQCLTSDYNKIINSLQNINDNICLNWNLTQDLYKKYLNDIINNLYEFNKDLVDQCQKILPQTQKTIVGVCFRNEYNESFCRHPHASLSLKFYKESMNRFDKNNTKYLIFSDNIEQSKVFFKALEENFDIEYTSAMQSAVGLCTMSLCDHIICANSSFSYWAAMLNKKANKQIICSTYFINPMKNSSLAKLLNFKWYPNTWLALDIL